MKLDLEKIFVMGILNITPDSFSDGGSYDSVDSALRVCEKMIKDGADIIDVGGESTRPGYTPIPAGEEIARAVPVIKAIKERFDIPVSIDTYKYDVALSAFDAGADMLNDIWGLKKDERLAEIVAAKDRQVCITHNREKVGEDTGNELIDNVASELSECVGKALKAGVLKENILLDPGIGFGKNYMQNLYLIGHIDELIQKTEDNIRKTYPDKTESGGYYPFMMAASRKGVIGLTLDLDVEDRDDATIAISVYSVMKGCRGVRVHDVFGNSSALGMLEALNTH